MQRPARRPLLLRFIRLDGLDTNPFAPASVVVLITDLEARETPKDKLFSKLFGLTAAEANLACALCNGETLADAAERLKIAGETARTRLKAIFAKTEIHKQGALVALLPRVGRAF